MHLEHLIQQLQAAHAKLGNHPSVKLVIDHCHLAGEVEELNTQQDEVYLDAAKQTVYLPVSSRFNP